MALEKEHKNDGKTSDFRERIILCGGILQSIGILTEMINPCHLKDILFFLGQCRNQCQCNLSILLLFRFRIWCCDLTSQGWFDFIILLFIACNCITLAMERPNIPPWSVERKVLDSLNHVFTVVFGIEMYLKVSNKLPHNKGIH